MELTAFGAPVPEAQVDFIIALDKRMFVFCERKLYICGNPCSNIGCIFSSKILKLKYILHHKSFITSELLPFIYFIIINHHILPDNILQPIIRKNNLLMSF